MPITFAEAPAGTTAGLARALPALGRSAAIEARAPAITRAADRFSLGGAMRVARTLGEVATADAVATPVYILGLADIAAGRIVDGARLKLWAHIVPTAAGAVSAESRASDTRFSQISNGIAVGRFRNALTRMATAPQPGDNGEVAQLRIPALHTTLLWLKGSRRNDSFEPVETSLSSLKVGQRYTAAELANALKPFAAQRRANPDADG